MKMSLSDLAIRALVLGEKPIKKADEKGFFCACSSQAANFGA
jgi:hypothetical protein